MRSEHSSKVLSAHGQMAIASLADEYGARETWLFGSAAAACVDTAPSDIDIAILGVPHSSKEALAISLREQFPGCRTDNALGYKVLAFQPSSFQLHFVFADDSRDFWTHPISRSIRRGICLWRVG